MISTHSGNNKQGRQIRSYRPMAAALCSLLLSTNLTSCVWVEAYRDMQIKNDEQRLSRLYVDCVERHKSDPQQLQNCKLILKEYTLEPTSAQSGSAQNQSPSQAEAADSASPKRPAAQSPSAQPIPSAQPTKTTNSR